MRWTAHYWSWYKKESVPVMVEIHSVDRVQRFVNSAKASSIAFGFTTKQAIEAANDYAQNLKNVYSMIQPDKPRPRS